MYPHPAERENVGLLSLSTGPCRLAGASCRRDEAKLTLMNPRWHIVSAAPEKKKGLPDRNVVCVGGNIPFRREGYVPLDLEWFDIICFSGVLPFFVVGAWGPLTILC